MNPFVHYRCRCCSPGTKAEPAEAPSQESSGQEDTPAVLMQLVASTGSHPSAEAHESARKSKAMKEFYDSGNSSDPYGSQSLSRLYFCDSCDEIRCPKCTQDEIVCYYCPNCLFDVPTASVKMEKHKCSRNCFECPLCQNTLSVVSEDPDAGQYTTGAAPTGLYYLNCNMCLWNSLSIGMTFQKPTGLAAQFQKVDEASPDVLEFGRLKDHLEKHFRNNSSKQQGIPSSILSSIQTGAIQSYRYVASPNHRPRATDDMQHYVPAVQVMEDTENLDRLMSVTNLSQTTTMKQRLAALNKQSYSLERLQPKRMHLRIKKSRRCRTCRHNLVNPEQKAQSIRFKINLTALNQIPNITIASIQPMIVQTLSTVVLRFTNPRHEEMLVTVQYGEAADPHHRVHVRSPTFTISPFNEVWEYEVGAIAPPPGSGMEEVYARTGNSTSIALDITPSTAGEIKIPLFVTFTFKTPKVQADTDPAPNTQLVVSGSNPPAPEVEYIDKTASFWTIIGFGDAAPTLVT
ncbi:dynactin p62 family-domain-containing protein [Mortierella sp. GBAus27b]|nr:dynactin p62 family-domain-containing protein [Mortierella sp. GBAus27b]